MKTTKRKGQKKAAVKRPDPRLTALHEEVERIRLRAERIAREAGPPLPGTDDKNADR